MGIADPQLTEQFGPDEGLAKPDHVTDIAAAVGVDHSQTAAHRVQLEISQILHALGRQLRRMNVGVVQLV